MCSAARVPTLPCCEARAETIFAACPLFDQVLREETHVCRAETRILQIDSRSGRKRMIVTNYGVGK